MIHDDPDLPTPCLALFLRCFELPDPRAKPPRRAQPHTRTCPHGGWKHHKVYAFLESWGGLRELLVHGEDRDPQLRHGPLGRGWSRSAAASGDWVGMRFWTNLATPA